MKKIFLSLIIICCTMFISSCFDEELIYSAEYVYGNCVYPVYYVDSYPYYWYNQQWLLIPPYRYSYIRHLPSPRYMYGPKPYHHDGYGYYGRPHTLQPNNRPPRPPYKPNNPGGPGKPNKPGGYNPGNQRGNTHFGNGSTPHHNNNGVRPNTGSRPSNGSSRPSGGNSRPGGSFGGRR